MPDNRVLVVGIDSGEAVLVRRLLEQGRLPVLARLLDEGRWSDVASNASIGSASVWPSFITGLTPEQHGIYNEWAWDAPSMSARRPHVDRLDPFWRHLVERGLKVGLLDVPFSPFLGLTEGFEVNEWGAHDRMRGRIELAPGRVGGLVDKLERHPYSGDVPRTSDPSDAIALTRIARAAAEGIALRSRLAQELIADTSPAFSVVVFPELHDAGHFLWHMVEPDHPTFGGESFTRTQISPSLEDLYVAVDTEIGNIQEACGTDCSVAVMSLHGMRSGVGWPALAPLLLERAGLLHEATWRSRAPKENLIALFGALKKRAPKWLRDIYRARTGTALQIRMARPTMIADHDWKRTKAFPVMDDHAGFVRVNLESREREGIVGRDRYENVIDTVRRGAHDLKTDEGVDLVEEIVLPHDVDPLELLLPDMILHWTDEAFKSRRPSVGGMEIPAPLFPGRTGRHAASGFCVSNGAIAAALGDAVRTEDLHRALVAPLDD